MPGTDRPVIRNVIETVKIKSATDTADTVPTDVLKGTLEKYAIQVGNISASR